MSIDYYLVCHGCKEYFPFFGTSFSGGFYLCKDVEELLEFLKKHYYNGCVEEGRIEILGEKQVDELYDKGYRLWRAEKSERKETLSLIHI